MSVELQDTVYDHLHRLSLLEGARTLFADLNYDHAGMRLNWPTDPGEAGLVEDPRIIATRGDFRVIYSRLDSDDRLLIGKERPIVERLLRDYPYSLFLFSDEDASHWHFVNVKHDDDGKRRRVHRRISVGPDERVASRLRTASEQLTEIALAGDELDRLEQAPLEIQRRHDLAFDVEIVTRRFYREYAATFELVKESITGISDIGQRRLFTQRLLNRLMFVAFVQRKGWLKLNGKTDYLNELWRAYQVDPDAKNFYDTRLRLLFFNALDNKAGRDFMQDNPAGSTLRGLLGDVQYLNGGLFEQVPDDDPRAGIDVPDQAIKLILDKLFNSFNFTVTESTPLDMEVAVDPEMLGKVFEELVTGRHESGSYYTPKPIVSFMCREALKGYLGWRVPGEPDAAIEQLVDDYDPGKIHNPEAVLRALQEVTACDPACGSGAYLLGLLHELTEIRRSLFASRRVDARSDYERKLEIIQRNIYGVDIDPFATNIAKLRLWLSLAVDYEGDDPPPLPNLDFKIETGDSLLGRDVGAGQQLALRRKAVEDYHEYKALYMMSHGDDKRVLKAEVDKLKTQLELWAHGGATVEGFDWPVEFAEVFAEGGFDIVLANPPYVRQELITHLKPALKKVYGPLYVGTADLYVFFYYRALEILRSGGVLAFISSNKWFRANYGKKLRAHIAGTSSVLSITDFGDLPVFESATAYPMIFLTQKGVNGERETLFTEVESLDSPYPEVKDVVLQEGNRLPPDAMQGERWLLADEKTVNLILTMERDTVPLGKYVDGQIYYGVKTGFNTAFVIDGAKRAELIAADPMSDEIIKPLAVGRDIRRWTIRDSDRWLIYVPWNLKIRQYPAIQVHLSQWRVELEKRPEVQAGRYNWWCMARYASEYVDAFDKAKIIYPEISMEPYFAYDRSGTFTNNKCYIVPVDDLYLLSVLGSAPAWSYLQEACTSLRGGALNLSTILVQDLPVPISTTDERNRIIALAWECVERAGSGVDIRPFENEINERVSRLYGLVPAAHSGKRGLSVVGE